jgi:hypothetical protein
MCSFSLLFSLSLFVSTLLMVSNGVQGVHSRCLTTEANTAINVWTAGHIPGLWDSKMSLERLCFLMFFVGKLRNNKN